MTWMDESSLDYMDVENSSQCNNKEEDDNNNNHHCKVNNLGGIGRYFDYFDSIDILNIVLHCSEYKYNIDELFVNDPQKCVNWEGPYSTKGNKAPIIHMRLNNKRKDISAVLYAIIAKTKIGKTPNISFNDIISLLPTWTCSGRQPDMICKNKSCVNFYHVKPQQNKRSKYNNSNSNKKRKRNSSDTYIKKEKINILERQQQQQQQQLVTSNINNIIIENDDCEDIFFYNNIHQESFSIKKRKV